MRWLVPFALLTMLLTSMLLYTTSIAFQILLAVQLAFYTLAVVGKIFKRARKMAIFKVPLFFTLVNLAIAEAWFNYFTGKKQVVWDATKR